MNNEKILERASIDEYLSLIDDTIGKSRLKIKLFRGQGKRYYLDSNKLYESIMPSVYRGLIKDIKNHPATIMKKIQKFLMDKNGTTTNLDDIYKHLIQINIIGTDKFPTYDTLTNVVPHLIVNDEKPTNIFALSNSLSDYESFCFFDYLSRYPKGCSLNNMDSIEAILIEMAQKGKPTRLLDVSTNPLVAIYNAIIDDNSDGVIYLFTEGVDYLYEYSFATKMLGISLLHSSTTAYIRECYLSMINASWVDDINLAIGRIWNKIGLGIKAAYAIPEMDQIIVDVNNFLGLYKVEKLPDGSYPTFEMNCLLNIVNETNSKQKSTLIRNLFGDTGHAYRTLLYRFISCFGLPILISPNFHAHEQIASNRILMQGSKFLLFPNKITNNNLGEIGNYNGDEYANKLSKIIIPRNIKPGLRDKLERIYNRNMLYVDALDNSYDD